MTARGATAYNPAMAAAPATGMIAKALADRQTAKSIDELMKVIASGGGHIPRAPYLNETQKKIAAALVAAQMANATAD